MMLVYYRVVAMMMVVVVVTAAVVSIAAGTEVAEVAYETTSTKMTCEAVVTSTYRSN